MPRTNEELKAALCDTIYMIGQYIAEIEDAKAKGFDTATPTIRKCLLQERAYALEWALGLRDNL